MILNERFLKNRLELRAFLISFCIHIVLFSLFVSYLITFKPTNLQEAIGFALAWSDSSNSSIISDVRPEIYQSKSIRIPSMKQLFSRVKPHPQSPRFKISPQHLGDTRFSSKDSLPHLMSQVVAYASKHNQSGKLDFVLIRDASRNIDRNISGTINKSLNQAAEYFHSLTDQYKASDLDYRLAVVEFQKPEGGNQFRVQSLTQDLSLLRNWLRSLPADSYKGTLDPLSALMSAVEKINFRSDADKHLLLMADEIEASNWERAEPGKSWEKQSVDVEDVGAEAQLILEKVIAESQRKGIKIDVLGLNEPFYKKLAQETGGIWMPIPTDRSIHPNSKLSTSWGEIKKKLPTLPTIKD